MIEIFIPVLIICINNNCEFMQAENYYTKEEQCRKSLDSQKEHMRELTNKAGSKDAIIEGTCIDARVKTLKGTEV